MKNKVLAAAFCGSLLLTLALVIFFSRDKQPAITTAQETTIASTEAFEPNPALPLSSATTTLDSTNTSETKEDPKTEDTEKPDTDKSTSTTKTTTKKNQPTQTAVSQSTKKSTSTIAQTTNTPQSATTQKPLTQPVTTLRPVTQTSRQNTPQPEGNPNPISVSDSGPVQVPQCGAYWGAYINAPKRANGHTSDDRLQAINYVENQIGKTFDVDHQFYKWDDFVTDHNIENYIEPSIREGRIPFISWKPVYKDRTNIAWAAIANGKEDALIREKAKQVRSISAPVIIVFGHEADSRVGAFKPGKTETGHIKTDAGSAQDFVNAHRHIHKIFEQEGVTNVSWAWVMTRYPFGTNAGERSADLLYPGDGYIDFVGLDPYNFFHGGRNWTEMKDLMQGFTNWTETRNITKPWIIGEWGSVEDPNQAGRKAEWLQNAADYFESEERLKIITHFDSHPEYNWLFDSSESSATSFAQISQRPYFNQRC